MNYYNYPIKDKRTGKAIALAQHDGVEFQGLNQLWEIFSLKSNVHIGQFLSIVRIYTNP
jgi:hypothetical protein